MSGRYEKETRSEQAIIEKLREYPTAVADFYDSMKVEGKSYTTANKYVEYVIHFAAYITRGERGIIFYDNVTPNDVDVYMDSIKTRVDAQGNIHDVSDSIRSSRWSALNTFYSFLVKKGYVSTNPVSATKRPSPRYTEDGQTTFLTTQEIVAILQKVKKEAKSSFVNRDLAVLSLALTTGLRISEISNLDIMDIDFVSNTISIVEKKRSQGFTERTLKFGDNLKNILKDWVEDRRRYYSDTDSNALFISQKRERLSTDMINRMIKKYTEGVTDKKITSQSLRASYAMGVFEQTGNMQSLAESINTSAMSAVRYAHMIDTVQPHGHYHMDSLLDEDNSFLDEVDDFLDLDDDFLNEDDDFLDEDERGSGKQTETSEPWERRLEAIRRLRLFKLKEAITTFIRGNKVLVSDTLYNYLRELTEEELEAVEKFEIDGNGTVYHAILCQSDFGQILSLLHVGKNKNVWDTECEQIDSNHIVAYCVNLDDPDYNQFCTIGIRRGAYQLKRIG